MTEPIPSRPASPPVGEPGSSEPPHRHPKRWHLPRWLHVGLSLLCLVMIGLSTWMAAQQAPHPDPFRRIGNWDVGQADWWIYPLERNAFKRTLVQGDLRAVFHLPGSKQVWVVGQGGLILHSDDGGRSWEQQNPRAGKADGEAVARAQASFDWLGWVPSAQAALLGKEGPNPAYENKNVSQSPVQAPPAKQTVPNAASSAAASAAPAPASAASAPAKLPEVDVWHVTLRSVHFIDADRGWVVGDHSTILSTRDGGTTWRKQPMPPALGDVTLRSLAFSSDAGQAWVVGDEGTFLHSDDGGATWRRQEGVEAKTDLLTGVSMDASGRGMVVGQSGAAYRTTDGGKTWGSVNSVISVFDGERSVLNKALAISYAAGQSWAVGVDGVVERFREGQGTTMLIPAADRPTLRGVSAGVSAGVRAGPNESSQQVWVVGDDGTMLHTVDGGASWKRLPRQTANTLRAVAFDADGLLGWVVGDNGTLLATTDGGQSWVLQAGSEEVFEDVTFAADGQRGWAIGPYGRLLQTADGGATWLPQRLPTKNPAGQPLGQLHSLAVLPDGSRGWAVGDEGSIVSTRNGGASWVLQTSPSDRALHKVAFTDDGRRGLAVGEGVILNTADGGQSWTRLAFFEAGDARATAVKLIASDIFGVALSPDGLRGWAVGARGALFVTTDGGKNWGQQRIVTNDPNAALMDVALAAGGQHAWAVGERGSIVSSQDGGNSWAAQTAAPVIGLTATRVNQAPSPAAAAASTADSTFLRSVAVLGNGSTIWAAGDNALLQSRNSGVSWEAQKPPGGTARLVRFHADGQRGWLVGDGASLHASTDRGAHWQPLAIYERHWAPWYAAMLLLASLSLMVLLGYVESGVQAPVAASAGSVAHVLSSDQPVSDKSADRLGFKSAVEALSAFIRNANTEPRITLAVTGEWGSGKSSIMRMLQTDLEQAGFRTAWFNAWHHQQEGRQLAALFNVVRQQAVPQLWRQPVAWLRVRSRLIWGRGFFYQTVAMAMAVVLAVAAGDLFSVGYAPALDNLKLNVKHYVLQEHQTIVTGRTLDKLDPFRRQVAKSTVIAAVAAAASAPDLLAAAGPAGAADTTLISTSVAATSDPITRAIDQPTAAGKPSPDPCDNAALKQQLQKAVPVRSEVYCYMKHALLWEPSGEMQQCGDTRALPPERHCVFGRPQDLVATIKAHIQGDKLRPSEEEAILDAAETLPPPVVFPWLQRSLLGGIIGFIVLLFTKGWTIGGLQILQPIKALLNIGSGNKADADKEPTGTVERCREEFGVLTDALGGRLVIFIDDLDRCSAETVNGLMELTNYLVDVGRCFVVLGAAMDRVMLCIKPPVAPTDSAAAAAYAQAYLRKLVHIELPVPPTKDRLHELMTDPKLPAATRHESPWRRALDGLWSLVLFELKWLRRAFWVVALVGLTYVAFKTGARLQSGAEGEAQPIDLPAVMVESAASIKSAAVVPDPVESPIDPAADPIERVKVASLLSPGASAHVVPRWWWAVGLLLPLTGLGWSGVRRYRARLTVALGGAIRSHDSSYFMTALRLWKDVVIAHDPTPRHVKRFYNRARLFSAYEQRDGVDRKLSATHDAHLVMMAALHHTDPARLQDLHSAVLSLGSAQLSSEELERRLNHLLRDWPPALRLTLWSHVVWFGGLPTAEQIERFEERLAGLRVG